VTADEVLAAAVDEPGSASASEPHAASIMRSGVAHATNATERYPRVAFTAATLQKGRFATVAHLRCSGTPASSPVMSLWLAVAEKPFPANILGR